VGAIDGTHVRARVPGKVVKAFRPRELVSAIDDNALLP
jgi:hypothetical protein